MLVLLSYIYAIGYGWWFGKVRDESCAPLLGAFFIALLWPFFFLEWLWELVSE